MGLLLGSCADPDEDLFHKTNNDPQSIETTNGEDNGGESPDSPHGN
ncbi:hypothetical protein C900_05441 [Fulvivirga imtechensis AK7]|uniref:Uncharacterized protein n=2 Tax=Fulvivirga TaxID=396811 RepID=L8JNU8_9BACT|nr:hypothetical protein C900_05441 [Fulvivirga imtechensis AK7]